MWAGAPLGPLRALALLVAKQGCAVRGVLEAVEAARGKDGAVTARVRLQLYLPGTLWDSDYHPWSNKTAPAAAFVFAHLAACDGAAGANTPACSLSQSCWDPWGSSGGC